jgi:hypothetical protein
MLSIYDVLTRVKQAEDDQLPCRFSAADLRTSASDFQLVVEILVDADQRGFFLDTHPHPSTRTGLIDVVIVDGLTDAGRKFLKARR